MIFLVLFAHLYIEYLADLHLPLAYDNHHHRPMDVEWSLALKQSGDHLVDLIKYIMLYVLNNVEGSLHFSISK